MRGWVSLACCVVATPAFAQPAPVALGDEAVGGTPALTSTPTSLDARIAALEGDRERRLEALEAERDAALHARAALETRLEALEAHDDAQLELSLDDLRPLASYWTRVELREGYGRLEAPGLGCVPYDHACVRYRARVGVDAGPIRLGGPLAVRFRLSPQAYGAWSTGFVHPEAGVYEGWIALGVDGAELTVGRFAMSYGDQNVIGGADWGPAGRAFDGARLRLGGEGSAWLDAFFTLRFDGLDGFAGADEYFYGLYADIGPWLGEGVAIELYALADQRNAGVDDNGAEVPFELGVTFGARYVQRFDWFEIRAEAATQPRSSGVVAGWLDAQLGFDFGPDVRAFVGGGWASERYDHLYPTGHAKLGLTDVIGPRRNVGEGRVSLDWRLVEQVRLVCDVHMFGRPHGDQRGYAGSEVDLSAHWTPGEGVRVRALGALFAPGPIHRTDEPAWYAELELGYRLR